MGTGRSRRRGRRRPRARSRWRLPRPAPHVLADRVRPGAAAGAERGDGRRRERPTCSRADATALDWAATLAMRARGSLCANLPYNVAVPVVMEVLADSAVGRSGSSSWCSERWANGWSRRPATSTTGPRSVRVAYRATGELVRRVPPDGVLAAAHGGLGRRAARPAPGAAGRRGRRSASGASSTRGFAAAPQDHAERAAPSRPATPQAPTPSSRAAQSDPSARAEQLALPELRADRRGDPGVTRARSAWAHTRSSTCSCASWAAW